jgi:MFS superfamily sulfate permease-like transporter
MPKVPGEVIASIIVSTSLDATSRNFAMKHGQRFDVDRDSVGLAGANLAAGLSATVVVNGSPTTTQVLDEQRGRTPLANITMSVVVVVLALTGLLTNMPSAVLAAIAFLSGIGLIDVTGLKRIRAARVSEFVIAQLTAVVVFAIGAEEGIVLAVVLSRLEIIRRVYSPKCFLVRTGQDGTPAYSQAKPGAESLPGLLATLRTYGTLADFDNSHVFPTVETAVAAFRWSTPAPTR